MVSNMDEKEEYRALDDVMAKLLGPVPVHQCTANSKQSGERCTNGPVPGASVCHMHGGKAQTTIEAADRRTVERQTIMNARKSVLEMTDTEIVERYGNPAETLQWVIAISRAMAGRLQAELAEQEKLTYFDSFGNIHVRGEVGAMLKSMDMAGSHAEKAMRLGLDQRGLQLREKELALLDRALDNALAQAGVNTETQRTIRRVLRAEILASEDGVETVEVR
jgi:hypothetical protein